MYRYYRVVNCWQPWWHVPTRKQSWYYRQDKLSVLVPIPLSVDRDHEYRLPSRTRRIVRLFDHTRRQPHDIELIRLAACIDQDCPVHLSWIWNSPVPLIRGSWSWNLFKITLLSSAFGSEEDVLAPEPKTLSESWRWSRKAFRPSTMFRGLCIIWWFWCHAGVTSYGPRIAEHNF